MQRALALQASARRKKENLDNLPHFAGEALPQLKYLGLHSQHLHNLTAAVSTRISRPSLLATSGRKPARLSQSYFQIQSMQRRTDESCLQCCVPSKPFRKLRQTFHHALTPLGKSECEQAILDDTNSKGGLGQRSCNAANASWSYAIRRLADARKKD